MDTTTLHTPGRMIFREDGDANHYSMLDDAGRWWLALLHNGEAPSARQVANMRRLAACWNACDVITTDALEEIAESGGFTNAINETARHALAQSGVAPVVVLYINNGVIESAVSSRPARLIVLDEDTEGGEEENIHEINGTDYYVTGFDLTTEGIDAQTVADIARQEDEAITAQSEFPAVKD